MELFSIRIQRTFQLVSTLMKDLKEIIPSLYLDVWLRWVLKLSVG